MHMLPLQRRDQRGKLNRLVRASRGVRGHLGKDLNLGFRRAAPAFRCIRLVLACTAVLATTECRSRTTAVKDISVREEIAPTPVREGRASLTIHLANAQGEPVKDAHIRVEGDMAHPGMAPVFGNAVENSPGTYEASIDFNMPGDWVVLLHIRLADDRRIERQMDVKGVAGR